MYKGYYELPEVGKDKKPSPTTRLQTLDKDCKTENQDHMKFLANSLRDFDTKGKAKANEQEATACVIKVNKQDFW